MVISVVSQSLAFFGLSSLTSVAENDLRNARGTSRLERLEGILHRVEVLQGDFEVGSTTELGVSFFLRSTTGRSPVRLV